MIEYTWKILEIRGSTSGNDIVRVVEYRVEAQDQDGNSSSFTGSLRFESPEGVVPFDQENTDTVIQWVQNSIDVNQPYSLLEQNINRIIADNAALVSLTRIV